MAKTRKPDLDEVLESPVADSVVEKVTDEEQVAFVSPLPASVKPTDIGAVSIPESMEFPRHGLREYWGDTPLRIQLLAGPREIASIETPAGVQLGIQGYGQADIYLLYPSKGKYDPSIHPSAFDGLWLSLSRIHPETGQRLGRVYGPMRCASWARYSTREEPDKKYIRYFCTVKSSELDPNIYQLSGSVEDLSKVFGVPTAKQLTQHSLPGSQPARTRKILPY